MLKKYIVFCIVFLITGLNLRATDLTDINLQDKSFFPLKTKLDYSTISTSQFFENLFQASNKFAQSNISASVKDFENMIEHAEDNDLMTLTLSAKLTELGLFNLSHLANKKISSPEISSNHIMNLETFFYPQKKLSDEDEMYFAELYSNIVFNNQSKEALEELLDKKEKFTNNDYANYLIALSAYNINDLSLALKSIKKAIVQNPLNISYKLLHVEILANNKKQDLALKELDNLKSKHFTSAEIVRKINAKEQYVLYKNSKQNWKQDYHLAYYYYFQNEFDKSSKILQLALGKNKTTNAKIQGLMAKDYIKMNNFENAKISAESAYKSIKKDPDNLINMGDLSIKNNNLNKALKYYKKATKYEKQNYLATLKTAETYKALKQTQKANKLYNKILKQYPNAYEVYYQKALLEPENAEQYLKNVLSINLFYADAWFELARINTNSKNISQAKKYLLNAHFINPTDMRYDIYLKAIEDLDEY